MSYAQFTSISFENMLMTLAHLVGKARNIAKDDTLQARLAPDMAILATQIRFSSVHVLTALNRLADAGLDLPESDPADFDAALGMIAATRNALHAHPVTEWKSATSPVEITLPNGMVFAMNAEQFARDWSLSQFYFHVTTFYAILRAHGAAIGKADYMPYMMQHIKGSGAKG